MLAMGEDGDHAATIPVDPEDGPLGIQGDRWYGR
jgi:hypothetical protein